MTRTDYTRAAADRMKANKKSILAALKKHGIESLYAHYDGAGDGDQVSSVTAYGSNGKPIPLTSKMIVKNIISQESVWKTKPDGALECDIKTFKKDTPLEQAVTDFVYDTLERHHPGWEINDGSESTLNIELKQKTLKLEHTTTLRRLRAVYLPVGHRNLQHAKTRLKERKPKQ